MGLFDRFRSKKEQIGKDKKPRHVVNKTATSKAEEAKRKQFASVPSADTAHETAKKQPEASKKAEIVKRKEDTGDAHRVLRRAVVSEKATRLATQRQYVFVVAGDANKISIGRAIEALYGVRPERVQVIRVQGKRVRYGRFQGRTKHWKKAIVTVPAGKSLSVVGT